MMRPTQLWMSGFALALAIVLAFTIAPIYAQHEDDGHDSHAVESESHESDSHDAESYVEHDSELAHDEHGDDHAHDAAVAEGHEGEHGEEHHEGEHAGGSKVPELPNLIGVIHHSVPHETAAKWDKFAADLKFHDPMGSPFTALEGVLFMIATIIGLSLFFFAAYKRLRIKPDAAKGLSRRATFAEIIVMFFEDFFGAILGRESVRQHLPLVGTLFIYILVLNSLGLIFLGKAPTANLSFNMGMAVVVFFYVHAFAIRKSPLGYLAHYPGSYPSVKELSMGPLGYLLVGFIIILFTIIHLMEAIIQPVSLSLRLFGNLLGKDVLLGVFGDLIPYVPLHTPFLFLGLLLGAIQALIFSLLTAVYITLWQPHEHHHEEHGEGHGHGHHKPDDLHPEPVHANAA